MIIGNSDKFAVYIEIVDEWIKKGSYFNGVLFFILNNKLFPNEIYTATYSYDIGHLIDGLKNVAINDKFYSLPKNQAFQRMFEISFPYSIDDKDLNGKSNGYEEKQYYISSPVLGDNDFVFFSVGNSNSTKILAAKVERTYDTKKEETVYSYKTADVTEVVLTNDKLNELIKQVECTLNKLLSFKDNGGCV